MKDARISRDLKLGYILFSLDGVVSTQNKLSKAQSTTKPFSWISVLMQNSKKKEEISLIIVVVAFKLKMTIKWLMIRSLLRTIGSNEYHFKMRSS